MRRHLRIKLPGSSMRRQGTYVFFLVIQWYSYSSFWKIMTYLATHTLLRPLLSIKIFSGIRGKFVWRVPPAAVHPGRARQCSGTGPCGYCRRVLWVPGPLGQYSVKICFIEKPGVQDKGGGRHVAKRSSDPRVAYPEVNVQVRDLVRVVGTHTRSDKPKAVYPLSRTSKLEAWNMIRSSMRRYHTYPPHRAPVGALCEGSSMRTCRYA